MAITLKICDDQKEWDNLVEKSPHGTIFHTWKFLKIIEKHTPSKLYPLIGMKGTTPVGIYPLFFQKRFFLKMVFSPPPHVAVPYLGPAFVDYDKLKQSKKESIFINFQKAVDEFISSELKADYASIATSPGLDDPRPLKWAGYVVEPKYNYSIDLRKGEDFLWKQLKGKLRQDINRERRKGVTVEQGSKKELMEIYDSLIGRYKEQRRVVNVPKDYLLEVYDSFYPQNMKIFITKYKDEFISGLVDIYYKNKASSWIGHAKPRIGGIKPNDLVQWEAIKFACESGFEEYEEIGAGTERLCRYKSKFNPELSICYSAKKYNLLGYLAENSYAGILKPLYGKIFSTNPNQ